MNDEKKVRNILQQLTDNDISIAIDDFGTGYSSLSYLQRYPFSALKVDRSFISKLMTDSQVNVQSQERCSSFCDETELVAAIIRMSQLLGLTVVAEGIETEKQLEFLMALHCDQGQGYYLGKPMNKSAFISSLEH